METYPIEIFRTDEFDRWLKELRDHTAVAKITTRLDRLQLGNFGDTAPVGEGVSELRLNYGPGYRIYYIQHGKKIVVILCGGDKSRQNSDIKIAKQYAKTVKGQLDGSQI